MTDPFSEFRVEMHDRFDRLEDKIDTRIVRIEKEQREQWKGIGRNTARIQWIYGVVAVAFIILSAALAAVARVF